MKARSITIGLPITAEVSHPMIDAAGEFAAQVKDALEAAGLEVQTIRLAAPPLSSVLAGVSADEAAVAAMAYAGALAKAARAAGFNYVSLGPVLAIPPDKRSYAKLAVVVLSVVVPVLAIPPDKRSYPLIEALPEILEQGEGLFATVQVGGMLNGRRMINVKAARLAAEVIRALAERGNDGFANLNFAAIANCPANIPFFPVAYYAPQGEGERGSYGLALETADLAVAAFSGTLNLERAKRRLVDELEREGNRALAALQGLNPRYRFNGLDFSTAPFPTPESSIGNALEQLGVAPRFGMSGTLFSAALLTAALAAVKLPRCGYSGLMLPVLEDSTLAARSAEGGLYNVDSLLLYSAVCGLGLDTVPLPGDISAAELSGILMDMAALALKLNKPLTARLFPVPGKVGGDSAAWDFPFFAPGGVLYAKGGPDEEMTAMDELVEI